MLNILRNTNYIFALLFSPESQRQHMVNANFAHRLMVDPHPLKIKIKIKKEKKHNI